MSENRINRKVFIWSDRLKHANKNWCFKIDKQFSQSGIVLEINPSVSKYSSKHIVLRLQNELFEKYKRK